MYPSLSSIVTLGIVAPVVTGLVSSFSVCNYQKSSFVNLASNSEEISHSDVIISISNVKNGCLLLHVHSLHHNKYSV